MLDCGTLRDLLLTGFAGGLRRSELVGLDAPHRDQTEVRQRLEIFADKGLLVILRGKTGWREVEIGRRHL